MFESAELGHSITKRAYDKDLPPLRTDLLAAQVAVLEKADFPLILLLGGVAGSGRGDVVNTLLEWMESSAHPHRRGRRAHRPGAG